jgi:hypothetical protein
LRRVERGTFTSHPPFFKNLEQENSLTRVTLTFWTCRRDDSDLYPDPGSPDWLFVIFFSPSRDNISIRSRPPFPSRSFPIHYPSVILPFDAMSIYPHEAEWTPFQTHYFSENNRESNPGPLDL